MSEGYKTKGYTSYHGAPLDSATCNKSSLKRFAGSSSALTKKNTAPMTPYEDHANAKAKK